MLCLHPVVWKLSSDESYRLCKPISSKVTSLKGHPLLVKETSMFGEEIGFDGNIKFTIQGSNIDGLERQKTMVKAKVT